MYKVLAEQSDIAPMLYTCYSADPTLIAKFHITSGQGLDACVDRTVTDLILNNVETYMVMIEDRFVGYFGKFNNYLTGFFLLPQYRTSTIKKDFWKMICEHFNGDFGIAIFAKNVPAQKFLLKNNCVFKHTLPTADGEGMVFEFVKESNQCL